MKIRVETKTITPDEAIEFLERNNNNRNIRKRKIDMYAADMKAGRWKVNGESIKFNGDGSLYDGQHRLLACVMAGKPFDTVVVYGLTESMHSTIDTGMARTLGDELKFQGEKDTNSLASVLTLVLQYDSGMTIGKAQPSRLEALSLLRREPEIRNALRAGKVAKHIGLLTSSLMAGAALMDREHGAESTDAFLDDLQAGVNYEEDHPCLRLRNFALNAGKSRMFRPGRDEVLAVVIKSMNAWLLGRPVKNLSWRRLGPRKEAFPALVTAEVISDGA